MELQNVSVALAENRTITVYESDWAMSRKRNRLDKEAPEVNFKSSVLDYFRRNYYPILAAVSVGDVPSAEEAINLHPSVLDDWYIAVWKTNSDWFTADYSDEVKTKVVTFRDGSKLTLSEARNLPSFTLRLFAFESSAAQNPDPDPETQMFDSAFYPKMAACVIEGEIPPADVVRRFPSSEINRWYVAAQEINPDWFADLALADEEIQAKQEKKKAKRKLAG